jgi:ribonuclease Z
MRELVVLGTASQVPTRTRNHNGYLLHWDGEGLLFDPGEGTQRQMIHAGVSASQITRICLTHVHGDHCFGLPGVLSRMVLDRVTHPVHLHYPASGPDIGRLQREGNIRGVRLEDVSVPRPGQRFAFVMDTAPCKGAEALADGADLLVAEATFSDEDAALAAQFAHLTAGQAGSLAATGGVGTLVLTHFSSRYGDTGLLAEQARALADGATVIAANDLDRISFPKRRSLS